MNQLIPLSFLMLLCNLCFAQPNIFPQTGPAGVGTDNPLGPFHIRGGSNKLTGSRNALILDNSTAAGNRSSDIVWTANGVTKWEMGNDVRADGQQNFYLFDAESTSGVPRFYINAAGDMGIGTFTPADKFSVNGSISVADGGSYGVYSSNGVAWANTKLLLRGYDRQDFVELKVPGAQSNTALLRLDASGRVGIGSATPAAILHLRGNSNDLSGGRNAIVLDNSSTAGNRSSDIVWAANGLAKWEMGNDIGADGHQNFYLLDLENATQPRLFINAAGNLGIGTASPAEKLSVNGKIRAQEIKVETDNWPDYVFENDYTPTSLADIESYIKVNKHLPEIPSAKEISENGLNVGEMNAKLLKKIEELTLHMIELKKENETLKKSEKRIDDLEGQLKYLMSTIK